MSILGTPNYTSSELKNNFLIFEEKQNMNWMIGVNWEKNDNFSLGLTFLEAFTLWSVDNLNSSSSIVLNEILNFID